VFTAFDGKTYILAANFGDDAAAAAHPRSIDLETGIPRTQTTLDPGCACVLQVMA
jgi:hypothetical protein